MKLAFYVFWTQLKSSWCDFLIKRRTFPHSLWITNTWFWIQNKIFHLFQCRLFVITKIWILSVLKICDFSIQTKWFRYKNYSFSIYKARMVTDSFLRDSTLSCKLALASSLGLKVLSISLLQKYVVEKYVPFLNLVSYVYS